MTSNGLPVRPPRAAAWLVELFASTQETDGVLGDLAEEFNASVERDGVKQARRHYQRQAWRTIRDLAVSPLRARSSSDRRGGQHHVHSRDRSRRADRGNVQYQGLAGAS